MKRLYPHFPVAIAACVCAFGACGDDDDGAASAGSQEPAGRTITVRLGEENGSGRSGTAKLTESGDKVSAAVEIDDDGKFHAHIHNVSCAKYRAMDDFSAQLATIHEPLEDLEGGKSETELTSALSTYAKPGYSINVHEYAQPYPVVACGDLAGG